MPNKRESLLLLMVSVTAMVFSGFIDMPDNSWFFVINAAISWGLVLIFLEISRSKVATIVAIVNVLLVFHNIFACYGTINSDGSFYLTHYSSIVVVLNAIELSVLLLGVTLSGIYTGVSKRRDNAGSSFPFVERNIKSCEV